MIYVMKKPYRFTAVCRRRGLGESKLETNDPTTLDTWVRSFRRKDRPRVVTTDRLLKTTEEKRYY